MATDKAKLLFKDIETRLTRLESRIERYTLDQVSKENKEFASLLDRLWTEWADIRRRYQALSEWVELEELRVIEFEVLVLERKVCLIQREIFANDSLQSGAKTVAWLTFWMLYFIVLYLVVHGVRPPDFGPFDPFPEWGPMKYLEVAFWSIFGVLCWLLYCASWYVAHRDFDAWYKPWYISTAIRAPFLSIVLMMIVLEFTEWSGEGTWVEHYLLEEGNKYYFIAFTSFCSGLMSDRAAEITRELADGVMTFLHSGAKRLVEKLTGAFTPLKP